MPPPHLTPQSVPPGVANVVVRKCRIHNDASVDISSDGTMLAALIPESQAMTMVGEYWRVTGVKLLSRSFG